MGAGPVQTPERGQAGGVLRERPAQGQGRAGQELDLGEVGG